MRLENLKNESPIMSEEIRKMIRQEVKLQTEKETVKKNGKVVRMRRPFPRAAVIALIAALSVGTTALAAVKYFQWKLEKEGNYGAAITAVQSETERKEELHALSVKANWLPEGLVQDEELKYSFETNRYRGGISMVYMLMDKELSESRTLLEKNVISGESISVSGHESIYLEKDGAGFNKRVYMAFPEYGYILECYGGNDLSKTDMIKILENLDVTETEQIIDPDVLLSFSDAADEINGEDAEDIADTETMIIDTCYAVGQVYNVEDNLQVTVKNVDLYDDLSVLNPEFMDPDMMNAVGEDGKIKPVTIRYMKSGDGVHTLDEETESEVVSQKLVYVTVEYKNIGTEVLNNIPYTMTFNSLVESGNQYSVYDRALAKDSPDIDYYTTDREGYGCREMNYWDVRGGEGGGNCITELKPGESIIVHMASFAYEDELDKLFLTTAPDGSLESGVVDARVVDNTTD